MENTSSKLNSCRGHPFTWQSPWAWGEFLSVGRVFISGESFYQWGGRGKDKQGIPGTGKGRCGRRAASGLCTEGVANVPGRGPGRSWGPLKVGKSEKYFPKLVFGQLQLTLSNDTKQTGIWIRQVFNPNRCLLTPHLVSPSQDALFAFSSLHLLKPGREKPPFPHASSVLGLPAGKLAVPVTQTAPLGLEYESRGEDCAPGLDTVLHMLNQ